MVGLKVRIHNKTGIFSQLQYAWEIYFPSILFKFDTYDVYVNRKCSHNFIAFVMHFIETFFYGRQVGPPARGEGARLSGSYQLFKSQNHFDVVIIGFNIRGNLESRFHFP